MSQRPIVQLIDLLGRKWVMRIIWELREGPCTFRALQERCGDISPTVVNARLKDLQTAGLLGRIAGEGYALTEQGHELIALFFPLDDFARRLYAPSRRGRRPV